MTSQLIALAGGLSFKKAESYYSKAGQNTQHTKLTPLI